MCLIFNNNRANFDKDLLFKAVDERFIHGVEGQ